MEKSEIINLAKDDVKIYIKNFFGDLHLAKVNWIRLFESTNSLYVGAFIYIDKYPYDEGCGIHMFRINTKTGEFTQVINLLEENEVLREVEVYV